MRKIVIYYSYGSHTRDVALRIKETLGCDILEIKPKAGYSDDYQKVVDDTEDNLEARRTPEIEDVDVNLDDYDTVIIGTPVWWYTIAEPIRTFLTNYDLKDKNVYAFATNAGWLGSTFDEIREFVNIKGEISIQYTTNHDENKIVTNDSEIEKWIDNIK